MKNPFERAAERKRERCNCGSRGGCFTELLATFIVVYILGLACERTREDTVRGIKEVHDDVVRIWNDTTQVKR